MIVLIDNYDSFTFNLVHYLGELGAEVVVHRNDKVTARDVIDADPDAIVLSPGPCTPNEAGICLDLVEKAAPKIPLFGVCLGLQSIGQAFGGNVVRAPVPVHGKLSEITHQGQGVFRGINGPFKATRYHSLVVDRATLPDALSRHRRDRRPPGDGRVAQDAPGSRRAVSSREHRVGKRPHDPEELSRPCGRMECRERPAARRDVALRTSWTISSRSSARSRPARRSSRDESAKAFDHMMSGEATPSQMGGFLMGLRLRGETVDEITGAVATMRAKMQKVAAPPDAIDVVGTGGDASGSYNISTCAAFIVAGAGIPVAKHGNRALSSKSGAADVLGALGVKIDLRPDEITRCIYEAGIGFMFAPAHHPAMKHVGPTRVELGTRTIFNLLGPLSNPASVKRQMVGVFSRQWVEPLANVLKNLGSERAYVVHGSDGLDEITTSGPTAVAALENGKVTTFEIKPEDVGLAVSKPEQLRGGDAVSNAAALKDVLKGKKGPFRDVALLNAAAAIVVAGKAKDLKEGVAVATKSVDSAEAEGRLDRLIQISNA